jgi:hypothetical protein
MEMSAMSDKLSGREAFFIYALRKFLKSVGRVVMDPI